MLRRLQRLESFGAKLVLSITVISGAAVLAISTVSGVRDYLKLRDTLIETVASQAQIVALNSGAAMAFGDAETADQALSVLEVSESVQRATLFDVQGRVFARWVRRGTAGEPDAPLPEGHWNLEGGYALVVPVVDRSGIHGSLQVHYTRQDVQRRALIGALLIALLSAVAVGLAFLAAGRIRNVLVAPVRELDEVATRVTETGNYAVRAKRFSGDELGRFTDRFNAMLGRFQSSREELLAAHTALQNASRLKDEFVATLSHELRTPMSPILAWVHMLRLRSNARPELEEGIAAIERNARMLVQIIDDLLDMSRIISGNLRLDVQKLDLADTIRAAIETVSASAESRGVRLNAVLDPSAGPVRGDAARLQQVVWNLLSNAIKFTPKGGRVQVSLTRVDSHVEIVVADNGIGIRPEFLPMVFERFRQADGSSTRAYGGLGLGLAIVKQLVELHGGTVVAHSGGEGCGASFTVCLPLASLGGLPGDESVVENRPADVVRAVAASPSLSRVDVLVVEDQEDMCKLVCDTLEAAGARVRGAASMTEALRHFDERVPHVLLSDIGMPGGDGYTLIRAVRARSYAEGGAVPAIALTAYARSEDRTQALLAGFQLHVAKPVEPIELLAAVSSLASNARRGSHNDG